MINDKSFPLIYLLEKKTLPISKAPRYVSRLVLILPTFRSCDLFSKNYFCKFIITTYFSQLFYTKHF